MLSAYYDKTATIKRLTQVGATDKKDFQNHLLNVPCLLQPIDASISMDIENSFGKNYLMMCDVADIVEGDRVFIDAVEYRIMGVESLSFEGHSHMELSIRKF